LKAGTTTETFIAIQAEWHFATGSSSGNMNRMQRECKTQKYPPHLHPPETRAMVD
jgi:hypothetical protein